MGTPTTASLFPTNIEYRCCLAQDKAKISDKNNPRILPRMHRNVIKILATFRSANDNNFEHFL